MRKPGFYLLFLSLILPCVTASAGMTDMDKSVVMLQIAAQPWNSRTPWKQDNMSGALGSGFIIAGNRILTNAHNVSNYKYLLLKKENIARRYPAYVEFIGHDCDLAILKVADPNFFNGTEPLAFAGLPRVNSTVSTYGFPMGGAHISVTKGVVSRIQMDIYVHSGADSHLVVQTDAAINPGNSGGPVIQKGEVVGVAFQGMLHADNIGYMIPTTVIKHFLKDINDGRYDGFGSLGITVFPGLHSESYKKYLQIPTTQDGVVVTSTMLNSSAEKVLHKGDVLVAIDNYDIDNDGKIMIYGMKYRMSQAIEIKQIGEKVNLEFYRNGKKKDASITIRLNRPVFEYALQYDYQPHYVCFAGMTFVSATRNFLETFGSDWTSAMPHILRYLFADSAYLNKDRQRKEYVVLSEILPDEINAYAADYRNLPLAGINGRAIRSLEDVQKAFEDTSAEFYILKFMGRDMPLLIDAKKARAQNAEILKKYNVPQGAFTELTK